MSALHITNGDSAANTLRTFLTERVLITCDVLHDGPAPQVDGDAWHDVRARFLASAFEADVEGTRASLAAFDRTVTEAGRHDELVLWFEHDLFDQLLLIRTLDLFTRSRPAARVSLICIGEFPGIERFIGLGQLDAEQLASLYPSRQPVMPAQLTLASEAWRAFRSDNPTALLQLLARLKSDAAREPCALPFLPDAIQRLFEEYPSTTNGLSRTATALLRALDGAPRKAGALFCATQDEEARPFLGDLGFFDVVGGLASARVPLVTVTPDAATPDLRDQEVAITDAGRRVLGAGADAVVLNGIDEWRGGVHLEGVDRSPWRWDPGRETLVS